MANDSSPHLIPNFEFHFINQNVRMQIEIKNGTVEHSP